MRPLLFYLKCLKDKPEVMELLKREIDVRPRFLLCDSPNARESEFVNEEIKYIKSLNRQYVTVNLDDEQSYDEKIQDLKRRSQIFLSYSRRDFDITKRIAKELQKVGFNVWIDTNNLISGNFEEQIIKGIYNSIDQGYFVPIISKSYLESKFCQNEMIKACTYNRTFRDNRVIAICIDEDVINEYPDIDKLFCNGSKESIMELINNIQAIDLKKNM